MKPSANNKITDAFSRAAALHRGRRGAPGEGHFSFVALCSKQVPA